jgi:branched-chain amino acid transport system ATP-binding protein
MTATEPATGAAPAEGVPLLEATGISKRFAGISALDDVSLTVRSGEVVGLIGPNGAGKTTFFNCLYGLLRPDGGQVRFDGRDISRLRVHQRARLGLGRTFQRIQLFSGMTVRDHLLVAARAHRGDARLWRDLLNRSHPTAEDLEHAELLLELLGLEHDADRPVEALSLGRGRLVELGRALMTHPRLLFLDEPSSGLDDEETAELGLVLQQLREDRGVAVVLVEHHVDLVRQVCERLTVLNFGTVITEGPTESVLADQRVRVAYLGEGA